MRINEVATYSYIEETSQLFQALALRHVMLSEGRLDEAGVWNAVKSAVGKGASSAVSGVKSANDAANKLIALAKKPQKVANFNTRVRDGLEKIKADNPKVGAAIQKYADWALKPENQWKQGVVIGAITALTSFVGTPGAGASMAVVLRTLNGVVKGEDFTDAAGQSLKTAAVGALAGQFMHALAGPVAEFLKSIHIQDIPLPKMPDFVKQSITINGKKYFVTILKADQDKISEFHRVMQELGNAAKDADHRGYEKWNLLSKIQIKMSELHGHLYQLVSPEYAEKMLDIAQDANFVRKAAIDNDTAIQAIDAIAKGAEAAAQGAASSGLSGKAAGAVKGAAGAVADKFRDFVPSKTYNTVSQQIKSLQPADKQKLVALLKQELATA
jgi:hypothetical protein